jgi:Zn-dependent peptidase ImmA (M78 family)
MKDKYELAKEASELRKRLGEDDRSPIDIFRLAHIIDNLTLIFYPMGDNISGMCIKTLKNIIIAINSGMSYGRQRFTMAHELYHCYFDDTETTICPKNIDNNIAVEKEANLFASFFLAPPASLSDEIKKQKSQAGDLTLSGVIELEQLFGLSRRAMLNRLLEEKELDEQRTILMKNNVILSAVAMGYDDTLYRPTPLEKQQMTYGQYIKHAGQLIERELVSEGKYEELLLEAFRFDMVYGNDDAGGELLD